MSQRRELLSLIFEGIQALAIVFLVYELITSNIQNRRSLIQNTGDFLQTIRTEEVNDGFLLFHFIERVQRFRNAQSSGEDTSDNYAEKWSEILGEDFHLLRGYVRGNYGWSVAEYIWRVGTCLEEGSCDKQTTKINTCYLFQSIPGTIPHVAEDIDLRDTDSSNSMFTARTNITNLCKTRSTRSIQRFTKVNRLKHLLEIFQSEFPNVDLL